MRSWLALYKKELVNYFYSLLSYIFIIVFLVVLSWLAWQNLFLVSQASMRSFFDLLPWFYLFLLPALSMRLWSEEKKQGTQETLLTLPLSDTQAVLAKLTAAASFLAIVLLCSLPLPITLSHLGNLDWGPVIGSYIGAWLLGCAYLAIGQWISALTKNQIVAFLLTIGVAFLLLVIGLPSFVSGTGWFANTLYLISTQSHFQNLAKGVIDLRDVIYYLSLTAIGIILTIVVLRHRRVGIQRTTQVGLAIASIVLLNIVLMSFTWRIDLTQNKQYTLADVSKHTVQQLTQPVTLKLYFSSKVPQNLLALRQDITDLLNEYKQAGGGHVIVDIRDPGGDTTAEADTTTYGIPKIQFNVTSQEKFEVSTGYTGLAIVTGDNYQTIPVITNTSTLEYDITAAIQKLASAKTPELAWLSDHGEATTTQLQKYLGKQYTVTPVKVTDLATTTATTLVIPGSTKQFSDDERYAIDQYMMKGNKVVVLLPGETINQQYLIAQTNATDLEKLLTNYGVTVNQDMVGDFTSAQTIPFGNNGFTVYRQYPLWPMVTPDGLNRDSPITAKLQSITFAWPASLTVNAPAGVTATDLAYTTAQAHSFDSTAGISPDSIETPAKADLSKKTLAVMLQGSFKSAYTSDTVPASADKTTFIDHVDNNQLVVIGDADFVSDNFLQQTFDNAALVVNSIDALSQDSGLISIRSRTALDRPLKTLTDTEKMVTKYTNIFSGVVVVVILAGTSFYWRKRRDHKATEKYV